jgi:hypothetical protein
LTFYAEYSAGIPDELNIEPIGSLTGEGERVLYFSVTCAGDHRRAEKILAPLRSFGRPGADNIGPLPYRELQTQAVWQDDSESAERIEAIRRIYAAIEPHTTGF